MPEQILADGYVIEPDASSEMLTVRPADHRIFVAAALPIAGGDDWRVVWFGSPTVSSNTLGANVNSRDEALEWLHRIGQLHAKAARS